MRTLPVLSVLSLLVFFSAPGTAQSAVPPPDFREDAYCYQLGETHWAKNNTGLLACGLVAGNESVPSTVCSDSPGACKWKSMSGAVTPTGLYGFCVLYSGGSGPFHGSTGVSGTASLPAQYNPYLQYCQCPSDYTLVQTGSYTTPAWMTMPSEATGGASGGGDVTSWFSCMKN